MPNLKYFNYFLYLKIDLKPFTDCKRTIVAWTFSIHNLPTDRAVQTLYRSRRYPGSN